MQVGANVEEVSKRLRWKGVDELLSDELAEVCVVDSGDAEVGNAGEL